MSFTTRREFLQASTATALSAAVPVDLFAQGEAAPSPSSSAWDPGSVRHLLPTVSDSRMLIKASLCAVAVLLTTACEEAPKSERWMGVYSYPNDSTKFSLYLDITIERGHVSGRAFDGNLEEATISGNVEDASYSLLLHPIKQGSSSSQDIHYRGMRSKDSIVGEWEHVVGVKGLWTATTTEISPKEALKLHEMPCERGSSVASRTLTKPACGKDA